MCCFSWSFKMGKIPKFNLTGAWLFAPMFEIEKFSSLLDALRYGISKQISLIHMFSFGKGT